MPVHTSFYAILPVVTPRHVAESLHELVVSCDLVLCTRGNAHCSQTTHSRGNAPVTREQTRALRQRAQRTQRTPLRERAPITVHSPGQGTQTTHRHRSGNAQGTLRERSGNADAARRVHLARLLRYCVFQLLRCGTYLDMEGRRRRIGRLGSCELHGFSGAASVRGRVGSAPPRNRTEPHQASCYLRHQNQLARRACSLR
jgi:hypothetical protein